MARSNSYSPVALDQDLASAVSAIAHRGPDGSGTHIDQSYALGHTRLAIIDLSNNGAQPMYSAGGRYVIVYNGEIYNFVELRSKLEARGLTFRGGSDTEVLLHGYIQYGPEVLNQLNGIFALAIADLEAKELFVARDQMGVKPLYYAEGSFGFAFSSEIKALIKIAPISRDIDPVAISQYLTFLWGPGERTLFKAVRKLDPGTALFIRNGRISRTWKYWSRPAYQPRRDWSRQQCATELRECVARCVSRQMISDAPVGAFLSGGVDSTAVVAAARKHTPDIRCFTMAMDGPGGSEMVDDLPFAHVAARALGVQVTEVRVGPDDLMNGLSRMIAALDEPLADPACQNLFFMSRVARQAGIKVLLSGTGGDDLMSGYRRHTAATFNQMWEHIPRGARARIAAMAAELGASWRPLRGAKKVLTGIDLRPEDRLAKLYAWTPSELVRDLMHKDHHADLCGHDVFDEFKKVLDCNRGAPDLEKVLRLDQRFFLADHNLIYTDKMGMAAGVEIRVPLLDLELVEFASRIPVGWKHRGLSAKWLFKQSQAGIVPKEIINRPKSGFGVPLRAWMQGPLKEQVRDLLSAQTIKRRGIFETSSVDRLMQENDAGRIDATYSIFSLMCIELWSRQFLDESQ